MSIRHHDKNKWSLTGIQRSCLRIGVIRSNCLDLVTMRAAKFWIACNLVTSKSLSNACLARFIWVKFDIQDNTVLTVWSLKVSRSSKITPRSLAQRVGTRSLPSKDRRKIGILAIIWRLPNSISLVFDALRRRWLSKHQFLILVRSLFMSSTTDARCWTGKVI